MDLCPQKAHPINIWLLAAHIFCAHKDLTFQIEQRAGCGGCHTMLTRAGFSNDFGLAHTFGQ